jgi:Translationally controlled tumour protein
MQDIITGDEILSDTFKIVDVGDGLWEVDCKMITKGSENFGSWFTSGQFLAGPDI